MISTNKGTRVQVGLPVVGYRDYYTILGVGLSATQEEIKHAYRLRALQIHPDKKGTTESFREVQEAYEILSNPDAREYYNCHVIYPLLDTGNPAWEEWCKDYREGDLWARISLRWIIVVLDALGRVNAKKKGS